MVRQQRQGPAFGPLTAKAPPCGGADDPRPDSAGEEQKGIPTPRNTSRKRVYGHSDAEFFRLSGGICRPEGFPGFGISLDKRLPEAHYRKESSVR
jgi:hypothetical protein